MDKHYHLSSSFVIWSVGFKVPILMWQLTRKIQVMTYTIRLDIWVGFTLSRCIIQFDSDFVWPMVRCFKCLYLCILWLCWLSKKSFFDYLTWWEMHDWFVAAKWITGFYSIFFFCYLRPKKAILLPLLCLKNNSDRLFNLI